MANEGDVDVHGSNVYLTLLQATLGIQFNRIPLQDDEYPMIGCVDFLKDPIIKELTDLLWKTENFGKSFEQINEFSYLAQNHNQNITVVRNPLSPSGFIFPGNTPLEIGHAAADPFPRSQKYRDALMPYLHQFCSYFSPYFILPKILSYLFADDTILHHCNVFFRLALPDLKMKLKKIEASRSCCYNHQVPPAASSISASTSSLARARISKEVHISGTSEIDRYNDTDNNINSGNIGDAEFHIDDVVLEVEADETDVRMWCWNQEFYPPQIHLDRVHVLLHSLGIATDPCGSKEDDRLDEEEEDDDIADIKYNNSSSSSSYSDHIEEEVEIILPKQSFFSGRSFLISSSHHIGWVMASTVSGINSTTSSSNISHRPVALQVKRSNEEIWNVIHARGGMVFLQNQCNELFLHCDVHGMLTMMALTITTPLRTDIHAIVDNIDFGGSLWVLEEVGPEASSGSSGGILISSATYSSMYLMTDGRGGLNTTPNRRDWELWQLQDLELGSPNSMYENKTVLICSYAHQGRMLTSDNQGRLSGSTYSGQSSHWKLYDTGRGSLVISNTSYWNSGNLQCDPYGFISLNENSLEWEHWELQCLLLDRSPNNIIDNKNSCSDCNLVLKDVVLINSFAFPSKYLQCTPNGEISTSTNKLEWEWWCLKFVE